MMSWQKCNTVRQHTYSVHGEEEVLLLLIHDLDTRWGVSAQRHAMAALAGPIAVPPRQVVLPIAGVDKEARVRVGNPVTKFATPCKN
jgi:hypothetical protein